MQLKSSAVPATVGCGVVLALLLAATGCRPVRPSLPEADRPFRGAVVRVSCPDAASASLIERHGAAWAQPAEARIEVVRHDAKAGPEAGPPADVWLLPPAEMPRHVVAGRLTALPETLRGRGTVGDWGGLVPLYGDRLLLWDRAAYALPLTGSALVLYYRSDLFADVANRTAFRTKHNRDLVPPARWDHFVDVAEFFQGNPVLGGPSLPALPTDDVALEALFFAVAAPHARRASRVDDKAEQRPSDVEAFSFHFDTESLEPRLETPGFVAALRLLQRLRACRPAGSVDEPETAFRDGRAVLCLADVAWASRFHQGSVRGKFGVASVPGTGAYHDFRTGTVVPARGTNRIPYQGTGGLVGVVPRDAAQVDSAFALLAELSGPRRGAQIVGAPAAGGGAYRGEHLTNAALWYGLGLASAETRQLMDAVRDAVAPSDVENPVVCLRTPEARALREALAAELRPGLTQETDAAAVLAAAARRWREIVRPKDLKTRQMEYMLSLSLEPPR